MAKDSKQAGKTPGTTQKAKSSTAGQSKSGAPRAMPKPSTEAQQRKKEEAARRARRRSRQWIGFALAVLIVVGAASIVNSGISLVQNLMDNTVEKEEYQNMLRPFVWFDLLPFESIEQVDQTAVKQVVIWGIIDKQQQNLERDELEQLIVPVVEVDRYASELFGPQFRFAEHGSFSDATQGLNYIYDNERGAYIIPSTSLDVAYGPTVVDIKREDDGIKRVIVGYVSLRASDGAIMPSPDYNNPHHYMDFIFQRDGNDYYLFALQRNTSYVPPSAASSSSSQAQSVYIPPEDDSFVEDDLPPASLPQNDETDSLPQEDESPDGGETQQDSGEGEGESSEAEE